MLKGIWTHCNNDVKIDHLSTLKACCDLSLKWMCEDSLAPKSLNILTKTVAKSTLNELLLEVEFHMHIMNNDKFLLLVLSYAIP